MTFSMNTVSKKFLELLVPVAFAFAMMTYLGTSIFSTRGMLTFVVFGIFCEMTSLVKTETLSGIFTMTAFRAFIGMSMATYISMA